MGLAPPTGEYAEEMLTPNGWPEHDEDINFDRAEQYLQVLRQVSDTADDCRRQQLATFDGDVWAGSASGAADREVGVLIDALLTLQNGLATVITWHRHIAGSIIQAKSDIYDIVEAGQRKIDALENEIRLTADERTSAITAVVDAAKAANAGVVAETAEKILASKDWRPAPTALQKLLDQKAFPPVVQPDESFPDSGTPGVDGPTEPAPEPRPGIPPLAGPKGPLGGGSALPPPSVPRAPSGPLPIPGTMPTWVPESPMPAAGMPRHAAAAGARGPSASGQSQDRAVDAPAGTWLPELQPHGVGPQDDSPRMAPASASVMPMAPGVTGGGGAGGAAPVAGSGGGVPPVGVPAGRMPSGVRAAAATQRPAPRGERVARRKSVDAGQVAEVNAMAAIPVSPARLERDAIAEAATSEAARRRGTDPLQLAQRVAAALNAPVDGTEQDLGFFWVTGVTTDGAIVVANSYGLAYIPDGVQLPEPVGMATADDAIPAAERARWATYPVVAVQAWAAQRGATLRAVIGTAEQLADTDPGAAKIVLNADDIPESGEMIGRSRLGVVNPEAAERLTQTPDARLLALLPPADANQAADQRIGLWIQVMKPMVSSDPRRQKPHLQAFHAYVTHAQAICVNEAHAAADPVAMRDAVADWLYWKHLTALLDAALSVAS